MRSVVEDNEVNRKRCICPDCPSMPKDCPDEILYCGRPMSRCDINARGCICTPCPSYKEYKLEGLYFCDKDEVGESLKAMRKKRSQEDQEFYQTVINIKEIAAKGQSVVVSMGSQKKMPFSLKDLHFIPAQIYKIPLNVDDPVNTEVIIGPTSQRPLKVFSPIMISGMSFGAVSERIRHVISIVAADLRIGFNSGEGGVLPEALETAPNYLIIQYASARFGLHDEILKKAAAIEVRFGEGAYPGKGSYLPASKITPEIAEIRGLKPGESAYSPAHHPDILNGKDLKEKVTLLRDLTGGIPIGSKIGCGNVEKDVETLVDAGVDYIALDGFGGGTGATDLYVRENIGLPIIIDLPRARAVLERLGARDRISLIAGGGLRTSDDFAKCLALGADAVYIGTAALIAISCEQYRLCHTGLCPTGVTTQNPVLIEQIDVEKGVQRLTNYIATSTKEIAQLTRIVGKNDVNNLDLEDLVSLDKDLAKISGVKWLDGEQQK